MVTKAEPVNPPLSAGWLAYAGYARFATAPRGPPKTSPAVGAGGTVHARQLLSGETFTDLPDAQSQVLIWCSGCGTGCGSTATPPPGHWRCSSRAETHTMRPENSRVRLLPRQTKDPTLGLRTFFSHRSSRLLSKLLHDRGPEMRIKKQVSCGGCQCECPV